MASGESSAGGGIRIMRTFIVLSLFVASSEYHVLEPRQVGPVAMILIALAAIGCVIQDYLEIKSRWE